MVELRHSHVLFLKTKTTTMRTFICCFLCFFLSLPVMAQRNEIVSDRIASLQVVAGDDWMSPPIIVLHGNDRINISFDNLSHDYMRYCYKLEHCEADWTVSEGLLTSDYCEGFADGNTIDDLVQSINTNTIYTHYAFQLPNSKCKIKISGNYKLTVYDENDNGAVAFICYFMVVDPQMGVGLDVTTNTDKDINGRYQQVEMNLSYGDALRVADPQRQIKTVVMQNGRWDNAVYCPKPQYVMGDGLKWQHCRALIFDGGNEYRKFEMLDMTHTTMGLENINWDGNNYHAYVYVDEPRRNYVYDEDANGYFYIRNSDNIENDYSSDYGFVHFTLESQKLTSGDVYINGSWTQDSFIPKYKMEYNDEEEVYELALPLKQGYYNYQYLLLSPDGSTHPVPSEGNFFQTENSYQALVYYRAIGGRTDQLVGYQNVDFK